MTLWDWIIEAITGPRESSPRERSVSETGRTSRPGGAIATLDRPAKAGGPPEEPDSTHWYAPEGATLIEPDSIEKPGLSHEGLALERALIVQLSLRDLVLPPLPRIPEAVLRQLGKANYSFREVAELISQDQVTATVVLRAANCALWGRQNVTSLLDAVVRLGIVPMRTIMLSESLRAAAFGKERRDRDLAGLIWRRSVAAGCIMRALAEFSGRMDPEDAFVAGLLHDVGSVIVLQAVDKHQTLTHSRIDLETFEYLCHECHQQFGELIADKWNLPPQLKQLIQNHHRYPNDGDPLQNERLHLVLADMINQMIGYGLPASYDLLRSHPVRDLALAENKGFTQFLEKLPDEIGQVVSGF